MVKRLLIAGAMLLAGQASNAQVFNLQYDFSAVAGTVALITTDPSPPPTATGITSGSFTAVGTGTGSTGAGRFSFVAWPTGATNANDAAFTGSISTSEYYNITLTPQAGYAITYNDIYFNVRRSGTGIRHYSVRSSVSSYASNLTATLTIPSNTALAVQAGNVFFWTADATSTSADQRGSEVLLSGPTYSNLTVPVSFRFYAWDAEASTGTFSIDSVVISGTALFGAGVNDISHALNAPFRLYPNPASDGSIYIEPKDFTYTKVEVLNSLGSVVATQTRETALTGQKDRLDLGGLPPGVYFISITGSSKTYIERIVVTGK